LLRAALGDQSKLAEFLVRWRLDVREQLRSDSSGYLGKKYAGLLTRVSSTFPDVDILNAYVFPLTSWSDGGKGPDLTPMTYRLPDVSQIAAFCERFAWGGVSGTLEKLHNTLWEGMCIKMLCKVRQSLFHNFGLS
jgi:holliday junction resolvase YEN1